MKPDEKKFILENTRKKSPKEIAAALGLRERKVVRFIELNFKEKQNRAYRQVERSAHLAYDNRSRNVFKSSYFKILSVFFICFLGAIAYPNSFYCSFHFDDMYSIFENSYIRNFYDLQNIWNFLPRRFFLYLSIAFNYHFNGLDVFGYHLFNLAVHLLTSILVWWLTLLTLSTPVMKDPPAGEAGNKISQNANLIAVFVGLVFVSHPVQTEAVTYIVQRVASMATLFYVATLCFYVKFRLLQENKSSFGVANAVYICSLITGIMAMFTKEIAITLPLMVLLYDFYFFKTRRSLNWLYIAPLLFTIFIIPVTMKLTESAQAQLVRGIIAERPTDITSSHYLFTQFRVIVTYIRLLFLPLNQNVDYDYPISENFFDPSTIFSFLLIVAILFSAKRLFFKYRIISFSIFWFFLSLLPESSVFPIKDVIYEHRLYLPMVGYSIFLVCGLFYLLGKSTVRTMVIILSFLITFNLILTYQRNKVWKDEFTLWDDAARKSPHKARPYANRGLWYFNQGKLTEALSDYNKAIELRPDLPSAHYNRGNVYIKQGKLTEALSDYNEAIEFNPDYAMAYFNRAIIYYNQNNAPKALSDLNKYIGFDHSNAGAFLDRGNIYKTQGNFDKALSDYNLAIELDPKDAKVYYNRAFVYYYLKEYDKARADIKKSEELGFQASPGFINLLKQAS